MRLVGRAIYFSARYFLPWTRIPWASIAGEAPHEIGRQNIISGLAWAITLVNMRHPAVMERLITEHQGELDKDAFANGVGPPARSIWICWCTAIPRSTILACRCRIRGWPSGRL